VNPFYLIASDGNLLPHPIQMTAAYCVLEIPSPVSA
jgi:hypothetical protein